MYVKPYNMQHDEGVPFILFFEILVSCLECVQAIINLFLVLFHC